MGRRDMVLGGASVLIALWVWAVSASYPVLPDISRGLSPAAVPRFYVLVLASIGLCIAWQGYASRKRAERFDWRLLRMPGIFLGLAAVYYAIMQPLGFLVATPAFLLAGATLLRIDWRKGLLFAGGMTGAVYVIFHLLLRVPLPVGMLWEV